MMMTLNPGPKMSNTRIVQSSIGKYTVKLYLGINYVEVLQGKKVVNSGSLSTRYSPEQAWRKAKAMVPSDPYKAPKDTKKKSSVPRKKGAVKTRYGWHYTGIDSY